MFEFYRDLSLSSGSSLFEKHHSTAFRRLQREGKTKKTQIKVMWVMCERIHDGKTVLYGLLPTLLLLRLGRLWRRCTMLSYQNAVAGSFLLENGWNWWKQWLTFLDLSPIKRFKAFHSIFNSMLYLIKIIINYFLSVTVPFKTRFWGFCGTFNVKEKYFPFFETRLATIP